MTPRKSELPPWSWWTKTRIHVRSQGQGAPVLFLHGIGGNAGSFSALADAIARRGYSSHAWDAPGYGQSADPQENRIDHASAVSEVLEALEQPVHLVGTSWGGTLAVRVALQQPETVQTLTLVDSTRGSAVSPARQLAMRTRLDDLKVLGAAEFARSRALRLVGPRCPPERQDAVRSAMADVRIPGYAAVVGMMTATDLGTDLAFVKPPTLVLVGEHDTVTGVDESRLLAEAIPQAHFGLILDAGHSAVVERPEQVAAHLRWFWTLHEVESR